MLLRCNFLAFAFAFIAAVCSSCEFDADSQYWPVTQVSYFMGEDRQLNHLHIHRIQADQISFRWEQQLNIEAGDLSDMQSRDDRLWLALANKNEIWEVEPLQGQLVQKISLQAISPHFLCIGDKRILISDSSRNKVAFLALDNNELIEKTLSKVPGRGKYRSKKFFHQLGEKELYIWHEDGLAVLDSVSFTQNIKDLQLDPGKETLVHLADNGMYTASVDYNTHLLSKPPEASIFRKIRLSPYLRQNFGKELLGQVGLTIERDLLPGNISNVGSVEVDFLESTVYYQQADSIYTFSFGSPPVSLGKNTDSLYSAHFFPSVSIP